MTFSPIREKVITLISDDNEMKLEVYREPNDQIVIWVQVGIATLRITDIGQAIDLIDILTEGLNQIGELDEFRV